MVCEKAGAKFILLGEHFVVHGGDALAFPISSLQTQVKIEKNNRLSGPVISSPMNNPETLLLYLKKALNLMKQDLSKLNTLQVIISSDIPIGAGLGASASLSVALIKALSSLYSIPLSPAQISELAYQLETIAHGTPSGIDNTVITYEQPLRFNREKPVELISWANTLAFLLIHTNRTIPTRTAIEKVQQFKTNHPARFEKLRSTSNQLARQSLPLIKAGKTLLLGKILQTARELLRVLDLETNEAARIIEMAIMNGASGGKVTGAGLGGFVVIGGETNILRQIQDKAREMGFFQSFLLESKDIHINRPS